MACHTTLEPFIATPFEPDFSQLAAVLEKRIPDRPTAFEFLINDPYLFRFLGSDAQPDTSYTTEGLAKRSICYQHAGYDYIRILGTTGFYLYNGKKKREKSLSQNDGGVINDRKSFNQYQWMEPENANYAPIFKAQNYLPKGMKIITDGPKGVLENVTDIVGYDNLCYMLADDPGLASDLFEAVGNRLLRYYRICVQSEHVGAIIANDDWGYNTQTLLPPAVLRKYVFPWYREIVKSAHEHGKYAILHSCGMLDEVMDDIVNDIGFDARHSYEDKIRPVEVAYELHAGQIAVVGGIDMNFLCNSQPEEINRRGEAMLDRVAVRGGYALGSGNSIPDFVPFENYLALLSPTRFT